VNTVLWIIAGLLAVVFLATGARLLIRTREQLAASGMGWATDVSSGTVKVIGALEVLGAIGLVLPALLDVATVLVPLAATGLALVMVGAAAVHLRHAEAQKVPVNLVLLVLAVVVAVGRSGPQAFGA
jgi:hypothetical protein